MRGSEREERRREGVLVYWVGVYMTDVPPDTGTRRERQPCSVRTLEGNPEGISD